MPWIEPKINWLPTDYFNAADYNRIRGNLAYLRDLGSTLYPIFSIEDTGEKNASSFAYASDINALERSVDKIADNTFRYSSLPKTKTWIANQPAPTFQDLNRLEYSTAVLYTMLQNIIIAMPKIPYKLGGAKLG